jgi:transcription termination/antitermination protein NusG
VTPVPSPVSPEEGGSLPWFALHVRSNHEFLVRRALDGQAVSHFLPTYEVQRGQETLTRPLFPGYLFARFDPRNRLPILKITGLLSILGDHVGPVEIAATEVDSIRQLAAAPGVRPHVPITHGQKVRIRYGPFMGREGVVDYQRGARVKVVFPVPLFAGATAVQLERDSVEAI